MSAARLVEVPAAAAPVIAALQNACFDDDPWDVTLIARLMSLAGTFAIVAQDAGGEPLGYVLSRIAADEAEILSIGVLPARRGAGIGIALMEEAARLVAQRGARQVFLEVAEDNVAARKTYAAAQFVAVGRRPNYYDRPSGTKISAMILRRDLPET